MILDALLWWLILQILALIGLPLTYGLFDRLPDRGYAFAKPVGLLLPSYALWLLGSLGILRNRWGAVAGCVLLTGTVAWWFYRRASRADQVSCQGQSAMPSLQDWLHQHRRLILSTELLLAFAFFGFAFFRAHNPDIVATEKPMELAFLNAILRSDSFPPHDPWLSGFGISYYYFGYVMMALLTRLSGLDSSTTFNLMQATLFAWTVGGAFSLGYNMVCGETRGSNSSELSPRTAIGVRYGILCSVLVAVMGNLQGLLEVLHNRGVGSDAFWRWVDIKGLTDAPRSGTWYPTDTWWWWRASRVIHDRTLLGQDQEVIDEFPSFSFLLGDVHPHVLALPFLLLSFALALQFLRSRRRLTGPRLTLAAVLIGSLGFLNTWDYPLALGITATAYALGQLIHRSGSTLTRLREATPAVVELLLIGVLAYLPFYLSFQSQAGGILPVVYNRTKPHQYLVMFGSLLVVLVCFLVAEVGTVWRCKRARWEWIIGLAALAVVGVCALLGRWLPAMQSVLLFVGLLVGWRRLRRGLYSANRGESGRVPTSLLFALMLLLVGLALTMAVEFIFLKDTFGTRMNTVFKFYYQAWACFGVAGAYGTYAVLLRARSPVRETFIAVAAVVFGAGLIYPLAAFYSKADGFRGLPTLDGTAHLSRSHPDDYAAIQWLDTHVGDAPIILEANGGSYTYAARISTHTGLPTVLGWGGHELQWRGNYEEPGQREREIRTLYTTQDEAAAVALLEKYDISFVYTGDLERQTFGTAGLAKFDVLMDPVFEQDGVTIYRRRP